MLRIIANQLLFIDKLCPEEAQRNLVGHENINIHLM